MPVDYAALKALDLPEREFAWGPRETMLYALGIGIGVDPMDRAELDFVYEKNLKAAPTMVTVLAWSDDWAHKSGIDMQMVVHGEMRIRLHRPVPPAGAVLAKTRILDVIDKGRDKGALVLIETLLRDKAGGQPLCTNFSIAFARGDGGGSNGAPQNAAPAPHRLPDRAPDACLDRQTRPDQALLYRLSGDRNPLHSDPDFAKAAGFPRPILHGLCTYGFACRAVLQQYCGYDPARLLEFDVRFSAPVFPGETVRTELWRDGDIVSYRARVLERDVVVLNNGRALLRDA